MSANAGTAAGRPTDQLAGLGAGALAMVAWAASGVIAKGIDLPGMAVVLYRMLLYSAVVLIWLKAQGQRLPWSAVRLAAPGGLALGLDIILYFSAVKATTIANATVIGALQPVLMLGLAGPVLGERIRRSDLGWAAVAIVGVAVVVFGSRSLPEANTAGDLLAAGSLVAWTAYFLFSKRTQSELSSVQYTTATAIWATLLVIPAALLSGQSLAPPRTGGPWFWLIVLAVVPGLGGHGLMNWSLTRIPAWLGSTMTLMIPVAATLLGWAFIGEQVAAVQFVGMAVVIGALVLMVSGSRDGSTVPKTQPVPT